MALDLFVLEFAAVTKDCYAGKGAVVLVGDTTYGSAADAAAPTHEMSVFEQRAQPLLATLLLLECASALMSSNQFGTLIRNWLLKL